MAVIGLADERGAQEGSIDAVLDEVIVTGGHAIGGVDRKRKRAAVGEANGSAQRVTGVLEVGKRGIGKVDEGTLGGEIDRKGGILAVLEEEARSEGPVGRRLLDCAGKKVIGDLHASGAVEVDVAVVPDLHERRGGNPISTLDQRGDGEGGGCDEEAGHGWVGVGL